MSLYPCFEIKLSYWYSTRSLLYQAMLTYTVIFKVDFVDQKGVLKGDQQGDLQYGKQGDPHRNIQVNFQGYPSCNQQGYPQPYKG